MRRLPVQLAAKLGRVDSAKTVVAGAVAYQVEDVLGLTHSCEDRTQHVDVEALIVGAKVSKRKNQNRQFPIVVQS